MANEIPVIPPNMRWTIALQACEVNSAAARREAWARLLETDAAGRSMSCWLGDWTTHGHGARVLTPYQGVRGVRFRLVMPRRRVLRETIRETTVSMVQWGAMTKMKLSVCLVAVVALSAVIFAAQSSAQVHTGGQPQMSSPEGLALLHKMQAALGGADKLAGANDFEETVKAEIWNNAGTPTGEVWKRVRWMRNPNILRLDQYGPRDTYVLFLDHRTDSGWEMLPDMRSADMYKTTGEAIPLSGGELRFAKNYLTGFDLTMWLADRNPGYVVTSPAANVLRIAHDGAASDTTLDPGTWLPLKSSSVSLADPNRPVPAEMRLEEWSVFDGIHFPIKRANYHSGAKLAEEVSQGPIRINCGLRLEALAAKPADFAPVIPGRQPPRNQK